MNDEAQQMRPRWAGVGAFALPAVVGLLVLGGVGYAVVEGLDDDGPSAEQVWFGRTLPRWWIAKVNDRPAEADVYAALPADALRAPLEALEASFADGDPRAVAAEMVAFNQAVEQAGLPFWGDVFIRSGRPVILTYEIVQRDPWTVGGQGGEVLHVARLDRTNVTTAFSGRDGRDLPVVLLDTLESALLWHLAEPDSAQPAEAAYRASLRAAAGVDDAAWAAARAAVRHRNELVDRMEGRLRGGRVRIPRVKRFRFPADWYADLEQHTNRNRAKPLVLASDLHEVRQADAALSEGAVGATLRALRDRIAGASSAHQAHFALGADPHEAPPPAVLAAYHGPDDGSGFLVPAHRHLRAALGAIRDSRSPACLSVHRYLRAAAGPHVRYTAYHYGVTAALHALLGVDGTDPTALTEKVAALCATGDAAVRARAGAALSGLAPAAPTEPLPTPDPE